MEVLEKGLQRVAVGDYQHGLARPDVGHDAVLPERQHALGHLVVGLAPGELLAPDARVERVVGRVPRVRGGQERGGRALRGPEVRHGRAVLRHGLVVGEAVQGARVPGVQAPGLDDGHGERVAGHHARELGRLDRALEHRREDHVDLGASLLQALSGLHGLLLALQGQSAVFPAIVNSPSVVDALGVAKEVGLAEDFRTWPQLGVDDGVVHDVLRLEEEATTFTEVIELIDEWRAGGGHLSVQRFVVGGPLDVFPQCPEGVLVRDDEDVLSSLDFWYNVTSPVWYNSINRVREGFTPWRKLVSRYVLIEWIIGRVAWVTQVHTGWRDVVAAAPECHIPLSVKGDRLCLRQALQAAGVASVQPPGLDHRSRIVA
mmetsp:Transcript_39277/g.112080  ORF Transcript_39277/g.112080 Transcript_39277/m.112080 type:complete len:373 (+) Transcript_39277:1209-2327(+)